MQPQTTLKQELTVAQRAYLGDRFYGLYMLSMAMENINSIVNAYDEQTRECLLADVSCACDNMSVPRYDIELSQEEFVALSERKTLYGRPNTFPSEPAPAFIPFAAIAALDPHVDGKLSEKFDFNAEVHRHHRRAFAWFAIPRLIGVAIVIGALVWYFNR